MQLIKSQNVHSIFCNNGNVVCYNTILNLPIVLDEASYNYFSDCDNINLGINQYSEDELVLFDALKDSYLLIPSNKSENEICEQLNIAYLNKVSRGETVEFFDLRVSEKCNFGCKHCISSNAQSDELMTVNTAIDAIDFVVDFLRERKSNFSKIDVHYGNAEPLMNFSLVKKIQQYLREQYPFLSRVTSINTNLSLLNEEMAGFFVDEDIAVYASLDGRKEANDLIRIFKNGNGTYDVIRKKMALLKKAGKALEGISVTITEANFPFFDLTFIDWCLENGFRSLAMDFDLVNSLGITLDERIDFLSSMWQKCNENNIEFFGTWITPFLNVSNRSIVDKHYAFCKGVHGKSVSIAPDGLMYICGSSSTSLGHYRDIEVAFSVDGKMYDLVSSRLIGRNEMCKGCIIEGACAGQCYVTGEYSHDNRRGLCDYYRAITEKLLSIQGASESVS
ncbi:radical SAM protein [Candidatus Parcubacteria bacterium]|nr:radical SAM protein [Candidatus Parcubacteria bacterium]